MEILTSLPTSIVPCLFTNFFRLLLKLVEVSLQLSPLVTHLKILLLGTRTTDSFSTRVQIERSTLLCVVTYEAVDIYMK